MYLVVINDSIVPVSVDIHANVVAESCLKRISQKLAHTKNHWRQSGMPCSVLVLTSSTGCWRIVEVVVDHSKFQRDFSKIRIRNVRSLMEYHVLFLHSNPARESVARCWITFLHLCI